MKAIGCFAWLILFLLCWPVALIALLLYPLVFVLSLLASLLGFGSERLLSRYHRAIRLPIDVGRRKK